MGLLDTIFGSAAASTGVSVADAVGKIFTSDDERLSHAEVMARIQQEGMLGQIETNKIEAASASVFTSSWRPAIGYVCALGVLMIFVINPLIQWISGQPGPEMPGEWLMQLTYAILGLGAFRTAEKITGRAK